MNNYENHLWPLIYDQYNHGRYEWELYGDFDKSQYSYESQEMIWIVKK